MGLHEKTKKVALSVAAIFSSRCSRVGKTQAFEDGLTIIYMNYNEYNISYDIWRGLFGLVLRFQILLKFWYLFRHGEFFQPPRLHCQALSYAIRIWYVLLSAAQLGTRLCSTQRHDVWDSLQHPPLQLWCPTQSRYSQAFIALTR